MAELPISPTNTLDFRALDQLKASVKKAGSTFAVNPQTRAVARQFESLFLQLMLKRMREATPKTSLLDTDQTRQVQGMADEQLALQLSEPGIGLAQALIKQIQGQGGGE